MSDLMYDGAFRLVWSDEFDGGAGSSPDQGTWRAETGGSGWGNRELQYYTDDAGNAALDGAGNLAIVARRADPPLARQSYGGCGYTSARLISKDRMSFRYGLVRARIKIPRARGIWPAFWMLGQDIGQVRQDVHQLAGVGQARSLSPEVLREPGHTGGSPHRQCAV
jgi:beta-glucanase (GH16 family)